MNIAITVCDNASAECPAWLGADIQVHWGLPDPTFHPGTDEERLEFCKSVAQRLQDKLARLVSLEFQRHPKAELKQILEQLSGL